MERLIKVNWLGRTVAKEVDIREAERIVDQAYNSGEMVVNGRTNEIVCELSSDVDELLIVPILFGG